MTRRGDGIIQVCERVGEVIEVCGMGTGLEVDVYRHEETERTLRAQITAAEERVRAAEAVAGDPASSANGESKTAELL